MDVKRFEHVCECPTQALSLQAFQAHAYARETTPLLAIGRPGGAVLVARGAVLVAREDPS